MAENWITDAAVLAGFAALGFVGGAFESALLASSRSRLRRLAARKGKDPDRVLGDLAVDDSGMRLRSTLLDSAASAGFLVYGGLELFPRLMRDSWAEGGP